MIVTAWNNGAHSRNGSGYGFRVHPDDRDAHFQKEWTGIVLEIEGEAAPVEAALDAGKMWGEAPYYILSAPLGRWLRRNGLAPWTRGNPTVFVLEPLGENRFKVEKATKKHATV
jgi:hypothetical protein